MVVFRTSSNDKVDSLWVHREAINDAVDSLWVHREAINDAVDSVGAHLVYIQNLNDSTAAQRTAIEYNHADINQDSARIDVVETMLADSLWHSRVSTASDSIDLTDKGGKIYMNVAGANNLTVVANSIKAFDLETEITVINWGAGQTTIVAGAGVTIYSADGALALRVQYSAATLIKQATDVWLLVGDIE